MKNLFPKKLCKPSRGNSYNENNMVCAYNAEDYLDCAIAVFSLAVFVGGILTLPVSLGTLAGALWLANAIGGPTAAGWTLANCIHGLVS